jgi:hypothetical protein
VVIQGLQDNSSDLVCAHILRVAIAWLRPKQSNKDCVPFQESLNVPHTAHVLRSRNWIGSSQLGIFTLMQEVVACFKLVSGVLGVKQKREEADKQK